MGVEKLNKYVKEVLSGDVVAGRWIRLACERHKRDLKRKDIYFDEATAEAAIGFFEKVLCHSKGKWAGQGFTLMDWQAFLIGSMYGWKHKDTGSRKYSKMLCMVARKNGKTALGSGMSLIHLMSQTDQAAEVYFAATTRQQARIAFDQTVGILNGSPQLKELAKVLRSEIRVPDNNGVAKAVSSEANNLDGLSVSFALVDEYHAHKNADVYNVLSSATGARKEPVIATITTAGFNIDGPLVTMLEACKNMLEQKTQDDATFCLIYTLDAGDDYNDPANWVKANPSLGETLTLDYLEREFKTAQNQGLTALHNFKTKHLNIFEANEDPWIQDEVWTACSQPEFEVDKDTPCYGGLDLASTSDITAFSLVWMIQGRPHVKNWYFLPEDTVKAYLAQSSSHIYSQFTELDNVIITEGNVTDYSALRKLITGHYVLDGEVMYDENCLAERYNIVDIAKDRWNSSQITIDLVDDGMRLVPIGQGFISLSGPTKAIERAAMAGELVHDGDPVLRWMVGNVKLASDPAGNVKPAKDKSSDKIDGVVSMVMALGQLMKKQEDEQVNTISKDFTIISF